MRLERIDLELFAREIPLIGHHLRTLELRRRIVAVALDPGRRIGEGSLKPKAPPAPEADPIGIFDMICNATGNDHVIDAGHHRLRGKMHGLLRGAALSIDGDSRYGFAVASRQPAGAGDVAGQWTQRIDGAEDDVIVISSG
jgi:hypothetical protein